MVGDYEVRAVVDSGAMCSLISRCLGNKLDCTDIHCTMVEVRGVGGGKAATVFFNAIVEFTVVGEWFSLNVLVIDTRDHLILGADFLSRGQNITIDFG